MQEKAIAHGALELLEEYLREHGSDTGTAQMALLTIGSLTDSGRVCRSNGTNCGAIWFCHIPFCPEVKGMPSFEWLKFKEGKTSGIPPKFQEFPNPFCLVSQKICMLLDARMILEWAFHSVNLAAAKWPK